MDKLIPLLAVLPLIGFYLRMFQDMTRNDDLRSRSRQEWMFVFLFLNVFGALLYYFEEYRNRR